MNCDDIKIMIYEYLDGELPKENEAYLFTHLSSCLDCREEFKQQNLIKTEIQIHQKEVSDKFEQRVYDSIRSSNKTFIQKYVTRKSPLYFSYMLGGVIILVVLLSMLQIGSLRADLNDFKGKYEATLFEFKSQTNKMHSIINASDYNKDVIINKGF